MTKQRSNHKIRPNRWALYASDHYTHPNLCGYCHKPIAESTDKYQNKQLFKTFCSWNCWQKAQNRRVCPAFSRLKRFFGRELRDYEVITPIVRRLLKQRHFQLICEVCGTEFTPTSPTHAFCSPKCERNNNIDDKSKEGRRDLS